MPLRASACGVRPVISSSVEADRAAVRPVAAGQHVEAGGLARAVRTHDAAHLAFFESERDVFEHDLRAEAFVNVLRLEERHHVGSTEAGRGAGRNGSLRRTTCSAPASPSGRNMTTTMNIRPYQSSQVSVSVPSTSRATK